MTLLPHVKRVAIHSRELRLWPGLCRSLPSSDGFLLLECSDSPSETLQACGKMAPCVVLMDCGAIDELDPTYFREKVAFGDAIRVIAYGTGGDSEISRYLALGCMGLVSEKMLLNKAVCAVSSGEFWASRKHVSELLQRSLAQLHSRPLTPREEEILRMIARGMKNSDIATKLGVTRETIRWHIRSLYSKIGVEDRFNAVLYGKRVFGAEEAEETVNAGAQAEIGPKSASASDRVRWMSASG